jgi:YidC/Oxa1 family membrane protein insertase
MDRRTLVAVVLCVLLFIFYQPLLRLAGLGKYLEPARPAATETTPPRDTASSSSTPAPATTPAAGTSPGAPGTDLAVTPPIVSTGALARALRLETPLYDAVFSTRGARLVSVTLKQFATPHGASARKGKRVVAKPDHEVPDGDRVTLFSDPVFGVDLGAGDHLRSLAGLVYDVAESTDASGATQALTFSARDSSGLIVRQTYRVRPEGYALDVDVELRGVPAEWRLADYSLVTRSWPLFTESDLETDHKQLRASSLVGKDVNRKGAGDLARGNAKPLDGDAKWAAVHSRYFVNAIALREGTARGTQPGGGRRPLLDEERAVLGPNAKRDQEFATNALVMAIPSELSPLNRFTLYVGPLEHHRLSKFGVQLDKVMDLGPGWMVPISLPLLLVLIWLNGLVHNYGVAIVLLATLVRLVLYPLNVASIRSMRALQKVQPEMERIRAKYKGDPPAMNAAMMALYKEHKVNPAGGCLPMLIQMPVFFALFAVLFNAIELRQAPFLGWLHDLSAPDVLFTVANFPIRLLPVLMTLSGLLLQRMTPTNPEQAPTMYLMNVFMLVLLYGSPSGLVLYWTALNLLTALQQWLVMRQDGMAVPVPVASGGSTPKRRS